MPKFRKNTKDPDNQTDLNNNSKTSSPVITFTPPSFKKSPYTVNSQWFKKNNPNLAKVNLSSPINFTNRSLIEKPNDELIDNAITQ